MRKFSNLILLLVILTSFQKSTGIIVNKDEAKKAFELLTDIRANPQKYYQEYKFPKSTKPSTVVLQWNETLAKVAEEKAYDMAKRNYFSHTSPDKEGINYQINKAGYNIVESWCKPKSQNFFESLYAGTGKDNAEAGLKTLIIDEGISSKGHRVHLLGLDEWNRSLTDIGIGIVHSSQSKYGTYMCVIIAKHDW